MKLPPIRQKGILIKRYKRFLADILINDNETLTVHCPNSGSMRGCSEPGMEVIISKSDNPKRKYGWTLEMVKGNGWIGINTGITNKIIHEALENGIINDFGKIKSIKPEIKVSEKSRLDFFLETEDGQVYLEVKNCSLARNRIAMFPDAITTRGTRHLLELDRLRDNNVITAVLFCIQRDDSDQFSPAADIDPVYAKTLKQVQARGVWVLAYQTVTRPEEIFLKNKLPVIL